MSCVPHQHNQSAAQVDCRISHAFRFTTQPGICTYPCKHRLCCSTSLHSTLLPSSQYSSHYVRTYYKYLTKDPRLWPAEIVEAHLMDQQQQQPALSPPFAPAAATAPTVVISDPVVLAMQLATVASVAAWNGLLPGQHRGAPSAAAAGPSLPVAGRAVRFVSRVTTKQPTTADPGKGKGVQGGIKYVCHAPCT